jgi:uncharacterized protein (DUF58 family)
MSGRTLLVVSIVSLALLTCAPVKTPDGLTANLTLDRTEYAAGDTLRFWLTFSNPTTRSVSLTFPDETVYEVIVLDSLDAEVIHFPGATLPVMTTFLLPPGGSSTDSFWFTLASYRGPIPPGRYRVRGKLYGYDRPYAEKPITVSLATNR